MAESYCNAGDCEEPTRGGRRYCEFHEKRYQRALERGLSGTELAAYMAAPKAEKLSPIDRHMEASIRLLESDAENEEEFRENRRAWIRSGKVAFSGAHSGPSGEAVRRGQEAARQRGVHIGRPPKVTPEKAREMVQRLGSVALAAKALDVDPDTVRRASRRGANSDTSAARPQRREAPHSSGTSASGDLSAS